jgi:hypothetical protein
MRRSGTHIVLLVAVFLVVAIVIASRWPGSPEQPPIDELAPIRAVDEPGVADSANGEATSEVQPATDAPSSAARGTDEASAEPSPPEPDFKELVEGVDPLLRERNVIVRSVNQEQTAPRFEELESRFAAEGNDASWSDGMEAQILDQVSQIAGLRLVSVEAECRETVCRLKLFYPAGTNSLASLEQFRPIASRIGLGQVVEVATIGDDGVPVSLLYFVRQGA